MHVYIHICILTYNIYYRHLIEIIMLFFLRYSGGLKLTNGEEKADSTEGKTDIWRIQSLFVKFVAAGSSYCQFIASSLPVHFLQHSFVDFGDPISSVCHVEVGCGAFVLLFEALVDLNKVACPSISFSCWW